MIIGMIKGIRQRIGWQAQAESRHEYMAAGEAIAVAEACVRSMYKCIVCIHREGAS
jgi:hypothetical protein